MKTFVQFLAEKGISTEDFEAKSKAEQLALHKEHNEANEAIIKAIEENVDSKVSKEELAQMKSDMEANAAKERKALEEVNSEQGLAIKELLEKLTGGEEASLSEKAQIKKFIEENVDKIKEMKAAGHGVIEMTVKVPESIATTNASNPDGIPELMGVQSAAPSNVNLRSMMIEGLYNTIQTNLAAYPYTDTVPKDGDYAFVLEKGDKPQIDFVIETRYAEPYKVAAHEVLTDEAVKDIPNLMSIAQNYLRAKHDLKKQDGVLFGTGLAGQPEGATVLARTFVAGAMANTLDAPNIMDVINACITDIFTTHNFVDEVPYMANLAMLNPVDFFTEFVAAKDGNGLPLYPMASLFNRVVIGGVLIMPFYKIPAGKVFVSDFGKYNISNYVDYTVKIGWINDQLITNQFTMVGESRFHAFVKELDKQAFIYDDIATIKAALTVI